MVNDGFDAVWLIQLQLRTCLAQSSFILCCSEDGDVEELAWRCWSAWGVSRRVCSEYVTLAVAEGSACLFCVILEDRGAFKAKQLGYMREANAWVALKMF
jgi:hypothetical protein